MPKKKPTKLSNQAAEALRSINTKKKVEPLWKGPESEDEDGGITQSMLGAFLVCRERFRIKYIEGLSPTPSFRHQPEYGSMWHVCEEALSKSKYSTLNEFLKGKSWMHPLLEYQRALCKKYPLSQEQIVHWCNVCKVQFPVYLKYYGKDKDQKQRRSLLPEEVFKVSYQLPSRKIVWLRGKWDGIDLFGTKRHPELFLWENKTKGDVDEQATDNQLTFDLQTMFYVVALWTRLWEQDSASNSLLGRDYGPLQGFYYNVIRRPLSGGVGSIRPHKETKTKPAETMEHFYGRLAAIIEENPGNFFYRWKVRISKVDVDKFKREFLDPILEQLCLWYAWASHCHSHEFTPTTKELTDASYGNLHWRHPYGVWNPMDQGRKSDVDEYLLTGSKLGLVQTTLFGELE